MYVEIKLYVKERQRLRHKSQRRKKNRLKTARTRNLVINSSEWKLYLLRLEQPKQNTEEEKEEAEAEVTEIHTQNNGER